MTSSAALASTHPARQTYHMARWLEGDLALKALHHSFTMSPLMVDREDGGERALLSFYCALGTAQVSLHREGARSSESLLRLLRTLLILPTMLTERAG